MPMISRNGKYRESLLLNTERAAWGTHSNPTLQFNSGLFNVLAETPHPEMAPYLTQRPGIEIYIDASETVADVRGRCVHYWEATDSLYFQNDDTLYGDGYANVVGTMDSGSTPVTVAEMADYLVFIDHENASGWYMDNLENITQITDPDFPSTLAGGGAMLDQFMFVMDEVGTIYQSNINNPAAWNALDIITAERYPDKGVFLARHHDHLVAFGSKSIEFFYDAGNPQASVLQRRQDVSYTLGCYDKNSVTSVGDVIFFVGVDTSGSVGVYQIEKFNITKISNNAEDALLTSAKQASDVFSFFVTSSFVAGHQLMYLSLCYQDTAGNIFNDAATMVYDKSTSLWMEFSTYLYQNPGELFPAPIVAVQWAANNSNGVRQSSGILANGDIIRYKPSSEASDGVVIDGYVVAGYVENQDDYVAPGISSRVAILSAIVTNPLDFGVRNNKFMSKFELVGTFSSNNGLTNASPFLVSWSDEGTFIDWPFNPREVYLHPRTKLTRLGYFNQRMFFISYFGLDRFKVTDIEVDLQSSLYA